MKARNSQRNGLIATAMLFFVMCVGSTQVFGGWEVSRTMTMPQPSRWQYLATSPDGSILYVPTFIPNDLSSGKVYAIDATTLGITGTLVTQYDPIGVAISPDGQIGYATNTYNGYYATKFDPINMTKIADLPSGIDTSGVVFAPNGQTVYMTAHWSSNIDVFDVATNARTTIGNIDGGGLDLAITPDAQYIYAFGRSDSDIYKVSTASNQVIGKITTGFPAWTGTANARMIMAPDGEEFYVTHDRQTQLHVFSTSTDQMVQSVELGGSVCGMDVTSDGSKLFVTVSDLNCVKIVSTSDFSVLETIPVPGNPNGLVLSPNDDRAYVIGMNSPVVTELVPEPATFCLMILGGLALLRRKRSK
jgi:DNA-binding beta-propeller fold protein YncE